MGFSRPRHGITAQAGQKYGLFAFLALASIALFGCVASALPQTTVAQANRELAAGFMVSPGDKLRVTVFDEPSLTGEYEVGQAGDLAMPLIEPIAASAKSPDQISAAIAASLIEGGYVLEPRVAVEILAHRPIYVLGQVNTPGEYQFAPNLTLEQAIAKAGGFTARASKRTVILQRQGWATGRRVILDGQILAVSPGDTITIEEAFF